MSTAGAEIAESACVRGVPGTIIAATIVYAGLTVSTTPMLTVKRTFEGHAKARHAQGGAIEFAIAVMQRCVKSPVNSGALKTQ